MKDELRKGNERLMVERKLSTYAARSSADERIVGADVSVVNMIHVAVVLLLAVLLIGYVDEGLLQNSRRGSLLLFEKVALSSYHFARFDRNHARWIL